MEKTRETPDDSLRICDGFICPSEETTIKIDLQKGIILYVKLGTRDFP